ncbi:TPA: hypothetical protein ACH3X2_012410 [Trebouxia sp. C0005]
MVTVGQLIDSIEHLTAGSKAALKRHEQMDEFGANLDAKCDDLFKEALQENLPTTFNALERTAVKRTLKKPGTLLEDDWLKRVPDNIDKMVAVLPALLVASDPFQSVSSFSNAEAKEIAYDFKLRLLIYYFNQHRPRLPPGLAQGEPLPSFNMQCMISKLWLERNIIEAAHIVSNATNSSRWGDCVLGINNVWDERNGLLWAQPFAKAYHAHEIAVMYESSSGTFKFRVLTDKLISKRLSDYGKSEDAK